MSEKPKKSGASVPRTTKGKYQPRATSSRATYVLGGVAIVVVAAVVLTLVILNAKKDKGDGADESALEANATMIVGSATAPTIDLIEDPRCPVCKEFEKANSEQIVAAVNAGKLRVRFQTLDFLNRFSTTEYSTRAAAALLCVAEEKNTALFFKFHTALFAVQPGESQDDPEPSNADLAQLAGKQGASAATQKCIADGTQHDAAAAKATKGSELLQDSGAKGTPTVLQGGTPVALDENLKFDLDSIIGSTTPN